MRIMCVHAYVPHTCTCIIRNIYLLRKYINVKEEDAVKCVISVFGK